MKSLHLLNLASDLKKKKRAGIKGNLLERKNVLLFEKTSTRTRCAFETGVMDEGGQVTFLVRQTARWERRNLLRTRLSCSADSTTASNLEALSRKRLIFLQSMRASLFGMA